MMELGPKNQNGDGLLGPNSIGSVYGPSGTLDRGSLFDVANYTPSSQADTGAPGLSKSILRAFTSWSGSKARP